MYLKYVFVKSAPLLLIYTYKKSIPKKAIFKCVKKHKLMPQEFLLHYYKNLSKIK